jgi:hypothetical protein
VPDDDVPGDDVTGHDVPDVDFVVHEAGPGSDEELPQPPERAWPRLRRAQRPLAVAAGLAVAAAAVVKLISVSDDNSAPVAKPSNIPNPTTGSSFVIQVPAPDVFPSGMVLDSSPGRILVQLPSGSVVTLDPSGGQVVRPTLPADPAACLPGVSCISSPDVPDGVLAAVRAHFPGARLQSATTVLTHGDAPGSRLWFRQLNAEVGGYDILLRVRQPRDSVQLTDNRISVDRRSITSVAVRSHGLTVQVQVDAPAAHPADLQTVRRLATDARLLVTS